MLATAGASGGFGMADATGAFFVCAALTTLVGVTGWFERLMDRIPLALEAKLLGKIRFGIEVKEIRQSADGVRVVYTDARGGNGAVQADYGIVTVPLSVLKGIPSDFSPAMLEAIASVPYAQTGKVGLQFKRRFWEEDDRIYGGISMALNQIFYPSSDYLGQKGVLVGYYNFGTAAADLGKLAPAERVKKALELGRKIHPQYDAEFETGYSIAWHQVPHSLGGWANYTSDLRAKMYPTLNKPDGRLYLAGEHLSYLTGWMAGAFGSARDAVTDLHKRVQQAG